MDWIKNLKVGDKVIIRTFGLSETFTLGIVGSISAKRGDIKVGHRKFRSSGSEISYSRFHVARLLEANEENLAKLKQAEENTEFYSLCAVLESKKRSISHDKKMAILKVLKENLE